MMSDPLPEQNSLVLGVDVGGQSTRAGVVDSQGIVSAYRVFETCTDNADRLSASIGDAVRDCIDEARGSSPVEASCGLALPGTLDEHRTRVLRAVNVPAVQGFYFMERLRSRLKIPTLLFTDIEAATWGEYTATHPHVKRFVHLRLGTGVGCGAVFDGFIQRLDAGRITHADYLIVDESTSALQCHCGRRGCLETVISRPALERDIFQAGANYTWIDLAHAIQDLDGCTVTTIGDVARRAVDALATGLMCLTQQFQPDLICVGGGVTACVPDLIAYAASVHRIRLDKIDTPRRVVVRTTNHGDKAGVIGSALLSAKQFTGRKCVTVNSITPADGSTAMPPRATQLENIW